MKFKYFLLYSIMNLSSVLQAEVPFEGICGLDEMMIERNSVFSPLYGFLALKTGTLERARFFGMYGRNIHQECQDSNCLDAPQWIHSAFNVRTTDDPHSFSKKFEYPLDPISSLIEWLFPSVDGATLTANDREGDIIGEIGRNLNKMVTKQKFEELKIQKERALKKCEQLKQSVAETRQSCPELKKINDSIELCRKNIATAKKEQDSLKVQEIGKELRELRAKKEKLTQEIDLTATQKVEEMSQEVADLDSKIEQQRRLREIASFFSSILKLIKNSIDHPSLEQFQSIVYPEKQSRHDQKDIFMKILFEALHQDGTLSAEHDSLYVKNIALHALLGYLWRVADTQDQIISIMQDAGLMLAPIALAQPRAVLDYDRLRKQIIETESPESLFANLTFEEKTFVGYGYEIYEEAYPPVISYGLSNVNKSSYGSSTSYSDCCETMLRNFFNIIFSKTGGMFDIDHFSSFPQSEKMSQMKAFYQEFSNIILQQSQRARDRWSDIMIHLNQIRTATDVVYNKRFCEIASDSWGMANVLNVMAKLTGDEGLCEPWSALPESSGFYPEISRKLSRFCQIFSRKGFKLDWEVGGVGREQNLTSAHGDFRFSINGKHIFTFKIGTGHFDFFLVAQDENDWRKRTPSTIPLLEPFYNIDLSSPFLDPLIKTQTSSVLRFWRERHEDRKIPLTLRMLYKLFGMQVEDKNAQLEIMRGLNALRDLEDNNSEHPRIKDFAQTLLIDQLSQKNTERAEVFKTEFTYPRVGSVNVGPVDFDQAIERGLLNHVYYFLEQGLQDEMRFSELAASNGHLEIMKLLIKNWGDMSVKDSLFYTASTGNHLEIVKFFVENEHISTEAKNSSLVGAAESGGFETVKFLIQSGADIEYKCYKEGKGGHTPLISAALHGHPKILKFLIKKGAQLEAATQDGFTALICAGRFSSLETVQCLVESGADINAKCLKNLTILEMSDRRYRYIGNYAPEVLEYLKEQTAIRRRAAVPLKN